MHAYLYTICLVERWFMFLFSRSISIFSLFYRSPSLSCVRAMVVLAVVWRRRRRRCVYRVFFFFMFMCETACSRFQSHMLILCMCTSICYRCSVWFRWFFFLSFLSPRCDLIVYFNFPSHHKTKSAPVYTRSERCAVTYTALAFEYSAAHNET